MGPQETMPAIFAKFRQEDILAEMGRLLFAVLNTFAASGYRVYLFNNIRAEEHQDERPYLRLVDTIDNLARVDTIPEDTESMIYLFDKGEKVCMKKKWRKKIQVRFDIFSPSGGALFRNVQPAIMPYPMHPLNYGKGLQARLEKGRIQPRKMRLFFSGDTEGYRRNRIRFPSTKLTRTEIINAVVEKMREETLRVSDAATFDRLLEGLYLRKFVLVENKSFRVDAECWLETLAKADFFLCPPGYVMPMCHNTVEAMAVGAIPFINYPEWFNPDLSDMETCVAFDSRAELIEKIRYVLDMGQDKIDDMRARVIKYYKEHLDPAGFVNSVEASNHEELSLLVITDAYVARNAAKVNEKSVLVAGVPESQGTIWGRVRHTFGV